VHFLISKEPLYGASTSLPTYPGKARKVDVRLPGKGNSNSHAARPVQLIITMKKLTRTSRLSMRIFFSPGRDVTELLTYGVFLLYTQV
jgi:hypothetical protein